MKVFDRRSISISLCGEYDVNSADMLRRLLAPAEDADAAVIDLSKVTYGGTTLLNALVALRKHMREQGGAGAIRLVGSSANLRKILMISQLDGVFDIT